MKKRIALDQLRPGMYLIGMDQSWWNTPFILHHRLIKTDQEILKLRQHGVKHVEIDSAKGLDVESALEASGADVDTSSQSEDVAIPSDEEQSSPDDNAGMIHTQTSSMSRLDESGSCQQDTVSDQAVRAAVHEEAVAEQVRDAAIQAVEKIFEGVVTGVPIDYPLLQETSESVVRHITAHASNMSQLVLIQNLRAFDKPLYDHVVDVCALTVVIGIELGWSDDQLHEVSMGALLHDIGYMRLPANLLKKRRNGLSTDSALLNQHSELGISLLKQSAEVPATVCRLVQEHHERLDGSGTPNGLKGSALSKAGQLIGVIDHFDSMTSPWGVAPQKPSAQVLRELFAEAKTGQFDVHVVERMIRSLGIYPVGSFVELSTKERGIVTLINSDDILKPVVKLISDEQGMLYPSPLVVDLAETEGKNSRSIKILLDPAHEGIQVGKYLSLVEAST